MSGEGQSDHGQATLLVVVGCVSAFASLWYLDSSAYGAAIGLIALAMLCAMRAFFLTRGRDRILPIIGGLFVLLMLAFHIFCLINMLM